MTSSEMNRWIAWRKELGLPNVSQLDANKMLRDERIFVRETPRRVQVFKKKTYLWGLIKVYKPIKVKQ